MKKNNIIVVGAGVFGTAIAERLSWNVENNVILFGHRKSVIQDININHRNSRCFPTRFINEEISATDDKEIFKTASVIMLALPSKVIIPFCKDIEKLVPKDCLVVNLAKGMGEKGIFITDSIPFLRCSTLKGPTFAIELINGFPSGMTFGGGLNDYKFLKNSILKHTGISVDYQDDCRAVELLSSLKNMYAIAIGIVSGHYNSPNVDFLIYTKAVNEMRSGLKLFGCSENSIFSYCGIGDLGLTSLNDLSRNRTLGMLLGKGFVVDNNNSQTLVEGKRTIKMIGELTQEKGIASDFPILQALYKLLYTDSDINDYYVNILK